MKKTILALFALIAVAVAPEIATAQNQNQGKAMTQNANFNRKQAKRAMRQAENEAVIARVNAAVKAQQFSFIATELTTSGIASLINTFNSSIIQQKLNTKKQAKKPILTLYLVLHNFAQNTQKTHEIYFVFIMCLFQTNSYYLKIFLTISNQAKSPSNQVSLNFFERL